MIGWLAIDFVFILPIGLLVLGKFPIYYTWLAYLPAVLIACVWAWRSLERGVRWPLLACVVLSACAASLGVHGRVAQRDTDPGARTYAVFNDWVRASLARTDLVYSDAEAFFAARAIAARVFAPTYAQTALVKGIPERDRLTALLVQAVHRDQIVALVGGEWQEQSRYSPSDPANTKLDFVLLRRVGKQSP
jgi:hypothetical protein